MGAGNPAAFRTEGVLAPAIIFLTLPLVMHRWSVHRRRGLRTIERCGPAAAPWDVIKDKFVRLAHTFGSRVIVSSSRHRLEVQIRGHFEHPG